jgi:hypothetical protein
MLRKGLKSLRPPWDPQEELLHWRPRTGQGDAWDVFVHYVPLEDGTFYVTEVDIRPHGVLGMRSVSELPDGGINARVFRSIRLGEIVNEIRSEERKRVRQHRIRARDLPPSGTRPGPHGHRDEVYETVAILYLRALEKAPYAPYPEMMRQLDKNPRTRYSRDTLRGWVSKARAKGFLTKAPGRRAGGGPGPMLAGGPFDWKSIDDDQAREQLSAALNQPAHRDEDWDDAAALAFDEE